MANNKYSRELLEKMANDAILKDTCKSINDVCRSTGVMNTTFKRYNVSIHSLLESLGVKRVLRGKPRRDIESMVSAMTEKVLEEKRWMTMEELASHVGMTGMGFRVYGVDTNELCATLGFPKTSRQGARPENNSENYVCKLVSDYKECILSRGSMVNRVDFCREYGYSVDSMRHYKISPEDVHKEVGVEYVRSRLYCYETVRRAVEEYVVQQDRYVTSDELREATRYSRTTIFRAIPSLTQFQADLGFFSKNYGFENQVFENLQKLFPEEVIDRQKQFDDFKSPKGRYLRYDFHLPRLNLLIEADGNQHYDENMAWYTEEGVLRDRLKDKYAADKGIMLHRVLYRYNFEERHLRKSLETDSSLQGLVIPPRPSEQRAQQP